MSDRELLAVRARGPESLRRRWYRTLAHAVLATPAPSGVLFESPSPEPIPWVTVRPASLVATVEAVPAVGMLALERRAGPPALDPPRESVSVVRDLVRAARSPLGAPVPDLAREPADLTRLAGARGWLAFQTFWWREPSGVISVARRFQLSAPSPEALARSEPAVATAVAAAWTVSTGVTTTAAPARLGARADWRLGRRRRLPEEAWVGVAPDRLERTAEVAVGRPEAADRLEEGHRVVFGASGAGKTTYLARSAARQIRRGGALLVIDLHGDLAPAIVGQLTAEERDRLIAIDASDPPVPGIAALASTPGARDRAAAHLVAALKRLSPDGSDVYWGFRLERIFDSFVRLVLDASGSVVDLYALLTDRDRREAARLATRRADLARFLAELEPVLRRQPDFLWSAATRLSKVALVPPLAELLAPSDGGIPVEDLLEHGRPVLVRIPFALLGPESAAFAGTLLLARTYLGLAARRTERPESRPVWLVLDEVHAFSPRLVAEILTESRKFGLRALVATQFPDRLAPELKSAVGGSLTDVVSFGVPRRVARSIGEWVGLAPEAAERDLSALPPGHGLRLEAASGQVRGVYPTDGDGPRASDGWREAVRRTRGEYPPAAETSEASIGVDPATERLLLATLAAEEESRPLASADRAVAAARALPGGSPPEIETLRLGWLRALREGWLLLGPRGCSLSPAGERRLGLTAPTGATRESAEHRWLLVRTFRIFARRGHRIEILRQGRYDTTLPDAVYRQLAEPGARAPRELAEEIERVRGSWAWRYFGGRDVHIEAEVSGALRAERIRRGWEKARAHHAFALFVVGDPRRARRVRAVLRSLKVGIDQAQVWTITEPPAPAVARTGTNA